MTGHRPGRRTDCTAVELDGCISVYSPRSGLVHHLNETATAVWRLLDGTRTADEVAAVLADTYQVPTHALRSDVVSVISQLLEHGLLTHGRAQDP